MSDLRGLAVVGVGRLLAGGACDWGLHLSRCGHNDCPIAVYADEWSRSHWADILALSGSLGGPRW